MVENLKASFASPKTEGNDRKRNTSLIGWDECLNWSVQITQVLFCISEIVFPGGPHPNSVLSEPVLPDGLSISNAVKSGSSVEDPPKVEWFALAAQGLGYELSFGRRIVRTFWWRSMILALLWLYIVIAKKVKSLSYVWLFATPWTVACQASLYMGFSRQEYWSGLPFPSPGDLPDPGIEPRSPEL